MNFKQRYIFLPQHFFSPKSLRVICKQTWENKASLEDSLRSPVECSSVCNLWSVAVWVNKENLKLLHGKPVWRRPTLLVYKLLFHCGLNGHNVSMCLKWAGCLKYNCQSRPVGPTCVQQTTYGLHGLPIMIQHTNGA